MVDIKWFLFEEKFTEYYTGINIYIDNRKKDYWRTTRFPTMEFIAYNYSTSTIKIKNKINI